MSPGVEGITMDEAAEAGGRGRVLGVRSGGRRVWGGRGGGAEGGGGGAGSPLATPCFAGVSSLGSSPYVPAVSLPSLPIHSCPPPLSNGHARSSATSTGRGG